MHNFKISHDYIILRCLASVPEEVGHGHVRHARLYGAAYVSVFSQSVAGNLKVTLLFSSLPKADFKYNLNPVEPLGP